jgi:ankyrin repeat protein
MTEKRVFIGLVLLAAVIVSRGSHGMSGDAPHYLAVSHSIAHDLDLDLRNQYGPQADYVFRVEQAGRHAEVGRGGRLYPTEGLGFSVLMTPVFAIADAVAAALPESFLQRVRWNRHRCARDLISFLMSLLYAWTAVLALRCTSRLRGSQGSAIPLALAFLTPPALFVSILALPEVPAALLCAWFLAEQTSPRRRISRAVVPLALLPWLHLRFLLLAIAGLVWLWRTEWASTGPRRAGMAPLAVPLASLGLVAGTKLWMFGSLASVSSAGGALSGIADWAAGLARLLFDLDTGLLWVAPLWVLALAGIGALRRTQPGYAAFAGTAFVGLWIMDGLYGTWRAPGPPGRFLVPLVPVLVPLLAEGLRVVLAGRARWLVWPAVAWPLAVTLLVVDRPARMWTADGASLSRMPAAAVTWMARFNSPAARLARLGIRRDVNAFVESVQDGNLDAVQLFLDDGMVAGVGLVPAVRSGREDVLALLLAAGAGTTHDAGLALAIARGGGDERSIGMLQAAGASLEARNELGETPLIAAVRSDWTDERSLLIQLGADLDATTNTGRTALAVAIWQVDDDGIRELIAAGADVNIADADGWAPLLIAARLGRTDVVRMLLPAGADVNAASRLGWTALMWAASGGVLELVSALLDAGAEPNVVGKAGRSALIRAAGQGHAAVVRALLDAGADARAEVDGAGASDWAARNGHAELAGLLARAERRN